MKAPPDRETLRKLYDTLGLKQDRAARYEEPALEQLLEHGRFDTASSVFELGPGTGRFAENLLTNHLPEIATYTGVDFSATMVALTKKRLKAFADRADVYQSDGSLSFERPGASVDRFVANYVLDFLSEVDIHAVLGEAERLLEPGGLLCLTGLSYSPKPLARLKIGLWNSSTGSTRSGWAVAGLCICSSFYPKTFFKSNTTPSWSPPPRRRKSWWRKSAAKR